MSQQLRIVHHAVLYALICRAVCEHLGREEGEDLMERATFRYGFRRGRRMAKNAETHNGSKDLAGYFLYGELNSRPGENSSSLEFQHDSTLSAVERCAWTDAWKQYGLWEYGRIYCRQVDAGLCTGYGGGFYLTVEETMGAGDDRCLFRWSEGLTPEEQASLEQKKAVLGNSVQKSYAFHCKELLDVVSEVLDAAGAPKEAILSQAMGEWEALFPGCSLEE